MTDYSFLIDAWPNLYSQLAKSEEAVKINRNDMALVDLRSFLELVLDEIYNEFFLKKPEIDNLYNRIQNENFTKLFDKRIIHIMHSIRMHGNRAAHAESIDNIKIELIQAEAYIVAKWFNRIMNQTTITKNPTNLSTKNVSSVTSNLQNIENTNLTNVLNEHERNIQDDLAVETSLESDSIHKASSQANISNKEITKHSSSSDIKVVNDKPKIKITLKTKQPDIEPETLYETAILNLYKCKDTSEKLKVLEKIFKSAEYGHSPAMNKLGNLYSNGIIIKANLNEAFKWYKLGAEHNNVNSCFNLASCYEFGSGVTENMTLAFKWYKKAAEMGHKDAQNNMGCFYEDGINGERDLNIAFDWFYKAASNGSIDGQFNLATFYDIGKARSVNKSEALKWYKIAADSGHQDAQNNLGFMFESGDGVEKNFQEAFKLYCASASASQGSSEAQNNLGKMLENGNGIEINLSKAFSNYLLSAEQGNENAYFNLASCYENGKGHAVDLKLAMKYYSLASEHGNIEATAQLGKFYLYGIGCFKDEVKAREFLNIAAEKGNVFAQMQMGKYFISTGKNKNDYLLGVRYCLRAAKFNNEEAFKILTEAYNVNSRQFEFYGFSDWQLIAAQNGNLSAQVDLANLLFKDNKRDDHEKNAKAFEWYIKAARQGHAHSASTVGWMYLDGFGVTGNEKLGIDWLTFGAEKGDVFGQNMLADCYFRGKGVTRDLKKAEMWYREAANQESKDGQFMLGYFYENGLGLKKNYALAKKWYGLAAEQGHEEAKKTQTFLYWLFK